jgi:hypothetical protein
VAVAKACRFRRSIRKVAGKDLSSSLAASKAHA